MRQTSITTYIARAFAAVLTIVGTANAASVSVNAVADAFVTSEQPEGNFGGAGGLGVSAAGLPRGEFQSVLRFDAAGVKSGFDAQFGAGQWSIQSATLRLTATQPNNAIFNASAAGQFAASWMANDAWEEGTGGPGNPGATGITFNSLPTFLGGSDEPLGAFPFDGATSGSDSYALALTTGFAADLAAGHPVSLRLLAADTTVAYLFNSRNFGSAANRPELTITAVPEPASLAGMLAATVLFGGFRRSRRTYRRSGL